MPRIARLVLPGLPHHVTHRGNRRGAVFFGTDDRDAYLRDLARAGGRYGLELWAYCLMTNHVHLIVRPARRDSLARTIGEVHGRHARNVHRERGWDGHLWANRYYSAPLDEPHLWAAARYVECNPVRAGIVADAARFPWSSAAAHCGLAPPGPLAPARPFPGAVRDWAAWLGEEGDEGEIAAIRKGTATGRPAGGPAFVAALEARVGRSLAPPRRGRPEK